MSQVTVALHPSVDPDAEPGPGGAGGDSRPVYGPTEQRILGAALRLVGRRGVKRLGMQEVSEAAGVSRGTLYRYFPSKDHLLAATAGYDERQFTGGLAAALAPVQDPSERITTLVAFAFDYIRTHPARSLFESEPEFVLGYLLSHLPKLQRALLEQLGEALDTVPAVASGNLTPEQLVDVIVRLFASSWIIPETDDRALVRSINGLLRPLSQ
ncbi:MAG TPA: TetR/AcrR family transcriptional regulator [Acidimicrobiales bacterium]|jgi:AcrR family transcriptional regulator|nr:TetR/AcrR family transcriptional regulator [Acidimicrobiales bacterium]